jgi:glycosyltransferase involved in cell wall biosynthesis
MDISVVIPLYNKKDTIERALRSVFTQTYQPEEIIVVNDGSTDGSVKIVEKIDHPKVRLIDQENRGVSAARNKGIETAKFEWIAFLDADDEWEIKYLWNIYLLRSKYNSCEVLATNYYIRTVNGKLLLPRIKGILYNDNDFILDNYFYVASNSDPPLWTSAVVVKKSCLINVGGFIGEVTIGEDLLMWARLSSHYKIAYSIIPSAFYNLRTVIGGSPSRLPDSIDRVGYELRKLLGNNIHDHKYIRKYIWNWHKMRLSLYLRGGMIENARKEYFIMINVLIYKLKNILYLILLLLPPRVINYFINLYNRKNI